MKIFVMGMQAAGKTVFVARLYDYVREKYGQKAMAGKELDHEKHMAGILDTLSKPDWPESTKEGHVKIMEFTMNMQGVSGEFNLVDAAGQDMEKLFSESKGSKLSDHHEKIKSMINEADMLIFLFDLDSVSKVDSCQEKTVNWWIFRKFCELSKGKKGLIVLSKADQFEKLSGHSQKALGDTQFIRSFIISQIKDFDKHCSLENLAGLEFCAVSSVATTTDIVDGKPVMKPKLPLSSRGFENVFNAIQKGMEEKRNLKLSECSACVLGMIFGGIILGEGIGVYIGGNTGVHIGGFIGGFIGWSISFGLLFWTGEFNIHSWCKWLGSIGGVIGGSIGVFIGFEFIGVLIGGIIGAFIGACTEKQH